MISYQEDNLSYHLRAMLSLQSCTKRELYFNQEPSDTTLVDSLPLLLHAPTSKAPLNGSLMQNLTYKSLSTRKFLPPEETTLETAVLVQIALAPRATIQATTPCVSTKHDGSSWWVWTTTATYRTLLEVLHFTRTTPPSANMHPPRQQVFQW